MTDYSMTKQIPPEGKRMDPLWELMALEQEPDPLSIARTLLVPPVPLTSLIVGGGVDPKSCGHWGI